MELVTRIDGRWFMSADAQKLIEDIAIEYGFEVVLPKNPLGTLFRLDAEEKGRKESIYLIPGLPNKVKQKMAVSWD